MQMIQTELSIPMSIKVDKISLQTSKESSRRERLRPRETEQAMELLTEAMLEGIQQSILSMPHRHKLLQLQCFQHIRPPLKAAIIQIQ
jgi:hypothetical protein